MENSADELARVFNDSYERVMRGRVGTSLFFDAFYQRFSAANEEVARLFLHTSRASLVRMLHVAVPIIVIYFSTGREDPYLAKIAERHKGRGADISPHLYSVWLDCLIETVRQFDPKYDDDVATAWRAVFSEGIKLMISGQHA